MRKFITTGDECVATDPDTSTYDKVFGRQYMRSGVTVLNKSQFMAGLKCEDKDKANLCNQHIINLYQASTGRCLKNTNASVFLEWDWMFAVSDLAKPSMLMGAIGFERSGDGVYVSYLYVRNHYKGMGVGSKLLGRTELLSNRICLYPEDDSSKSWYNNRGYQESEYENNTWIKEKNQCPELPL